jgi:NAD-dependent dihydropyrimidine dehydrogenase PreA subunit
VIRFTLPVKAKGQWLGKLLDRFSVFLPEVSQDRVHWHRLAPTDFGQQQDFFTPALERIRAAESVKSFMFQPRQRVASMPEAKPPQEEKPRLLIGAKNCDLVPLKVHDRILSEGQFSDPFYNAQRRRTMVIAADCPKPEDSCFCNLLGQQPYARDVADATLAVVDGSYLFESLTPEGEELLKADASLMQPATDAQVGARDEARRAAVEALGRTNPKPLDPDLPGAVAKKLGDEAFWNRHAATCVECYGCLMGCPTCYCFLLYDRAKDAGLERTRVWDACYEAAYARVGGGANPRAEFVKRFANRFDCKFNQFKHDHGFYSCSGCGRCFRACMGKIDIRKVLADL